VGIDNKGADAKINEMIEGKSDERLLKNRHERLRQLVGERAQPGAKPRA
jgi:hypothetical protein